MSTIYIPQKRIYAPNDPFFEEGNIALRALWLKRQAASDAEVHMIQQEQQDLLDQHHIDIYCDHCRIRFPSVVTFESHYEAVHRNVCLECHKIFPSFDWLQLHIDEFHNVLLQIKKERGEKIYKCYVHGCKKVFSGPRQRRLHLIDKHNYPRYFPFDLVYTGTLSFEQRKVRDQKNKERLKRLSMHGHKDTDMDEEHRSTEEESKKDVDMDELVTGMSKLRIPKSISFGHKAGLGIPQHRPHRPSIENLKPEVKVYSHPRKRGPKKKKMSGAEPMIE
ncbi:hypothetical protein INT47_007144 [Mucor saturninus]|uniref:C2H2-type domain-containing protein n=1 Tax=Mucor saturninus TaxID=64648 RepID=A0A8H7V8R4_9FUNG|nr:hypothetical protein INT47_007144 [Mucor saturninus]